MTPPNEFERAVGKGLRALAVAFEDAGKHQLSEIYSQAGKRLNPSHLECEHIGTLGYVEVSVSHSNGSYQRRYWECQTCGYVRQSTPQGWGEPQ